MTQPKFLLLKWWGFLSAGSRPGQDHKWAALRPPPQAHGPPGEARPGRAGQLSSTRADTVTPEGGRDQDLGKGVQLSTLPAWQRGPPLSCCDLNQVGREHGPGLGHNGASSVLGNIGGSLCSLLPLSKGPGPPQQAPPCPT